MTACACMGPQNGEPVCPCRMKSGDIPGAQWVRFDQEDQAERLKLIRRVIEEHREVLEKLKDR